MIDICPFDHNRPVGFPTGSSERDFACIYPQMFLIRNIPSHFCDEAIGRDVKKALPDTVHFNVRQNDSPDSEKWVVGVRGSSSSHMKSQHRIKICGVKFEVWQYFVRKCNIVPLEPVHLDKNDLGASPKQDFDRAFLTSEVSSRIRCFTRLKVLTWNTLFNRYNGQHGIELHSTIRYEAILQVLKEENADVVALQEVEKEFWDVLAGDSWIRGRYTLSSMWCEWASCLLLCSNELDLQNSCAHELPGSSKSFCSPMVAVQLRLACHSCSQPFSFIVCTTHLLAYNTGVRQYQKLNLHQKFQPDKYHWNDCILMGDFNEQWTVPDDMEMTDVWHELHGSLDPGWTMDNKRNMLAEVTEQKVEYNGRIDLILYRSKRFHAVESHLIGTTPVSTILSKESESSEIPNYLFPSDHFGVVAVFETISK